MNRVHRHNLLICLVGLPRAGKSTWCNEVGFPIVSLDAIKLATYGQRFWLYGNDRIYIDATHMIKSLFLTGNNTVILDDVNVTREQRDYWRPVINHPLGFGPEASGYEITPKPLRVEWDIQFKVFNTPKDVCIERAKKTEQFDLIPVIEGMADIFEPLQEDEVEYED